MSEAIELALKNSALNLGKWILTGVVNSSFWICLTAAIISIILYGCGMKKVGKVVPISFVIYVILQCVRGSFL